MKLTVDNHQGTRFGAERITEIPADLDVSGLDGITVLATSRVLVYPFDVEGEVFPGALPIAGESTTSSGYVAQYDLRGVAKVRIDGDVESVDVFGAFTGVDY